MNSLRTSGARAALAVPGFARLWIAGGISAFGDSFTSLALVVLVLRITHSTAAVAGLMIATSLPQVLLGLHSGWVVDRHDRRRVMIASEILRGLFVLGLVMVREARDLPLLYGLAIAQAAVGVFFEPARGALVPRLVPPALRLSANALDQTLRLAAITAGAAFAGLVIAAPGGTPLAFTLDALTFGVSAALLAGLPRPPAAVATLASDEVAEPGAAGAFTLGLRTLLARPALRGLFMTFAVSTLALGFMNVSFVPFVLEDLRASTARLGLVRAAQTLGIAAGGALVGAIGSRLPPRGLMVAGIAGLGLGFATLAMLHGVPALYVVMPMLGLASSALQAGSTTLLQQHSPDPLRGRIESALDTLLAVILMGAMAGAGALAHSLGERQLFRIASIVTLVGGIIGALWIPGSLRPGHEEKSVDR